MKISHSASPRNRSSRSSRSPPAGNKIAGTDAADAAAVSRTTASAAPASGGPAIRSAIDVIWHRFSTGRLYTLARQEGTRQEGKSVSARELHASGEVVRRVTPPAFRLELC